MKRSITLFSIITLAVLLASCSLIFPQSTPTPEPLPTGTSNLQVTLQDSGKTITLHVSDSFLLYLGDTYQWTVEIADQAIVSRVPNIMVIRGAQGIYTAHAVGITTLSATGNPACYYSKPPCLMPSILFQVTIVVTQ